MEFHPKIMDLFLLFIFHNGTLSELMFTGLSANAASTNYFLNSHDLNELDFIKLC